ncbi:MAG: hypothetical protein MJZ38_07220 [archaeon]|nr:hypothetical protein [archaeon]
MLAVSGGSLGFEGLYRLSQDEVVQSMGKSDYLIILGNCGVTEVHADFYDNLALYRDLPCSVLFLDGSTDDYDLLSDHPLFPWNGGMTQSMSRGITHLMRGQVFRIDGRTILTMGGCSTVGRTDLGKYYDWYPEQDIFPADLQAAESNLEEVDGKVDLVLTCDCPASWRAGSATDCLQTSRCLDDLASLVTYRHWYFSNPVQMELPTVSATGVAQTCIII